MAEIDGSIPYRPRRPDVIDEQFEGEAVVVNLASGVYYAFNPTASAIWSALAVGRSADTAARLLELPPAVVVAFCAQLLAEELIEVAPAEAGDDASPVPAGDPGEEPRIQRFTDMQDLLMLDPIHDIDLGGDGWPLVPEQA